MIIYIMNICYFSYKEMLEAGFLNSASQNKDPLAEANCSSTKLLSSKCYKVESKIFTLLNCSSGNHIINILRKYY